MRPLIRLAPRLMGLGSTEGRLRALAQVAAIAVATVAVLGLLAAPGVLDARQDRADARQPLSGVGDVRARNLVESWDGTPVTRVLVAASRSAGVTGLPPGVDRLPAPGEALASPNLLTLIHREPRASGLLSGAQVIGTVGPSGLVAPGELFAYIGVSSTRSLLPVASFGAEALPVTADSQVTLAVLYLIGLLVWVPALILVMVTSRYGARLNEERLRLLILLGVRAGRLRVLAAVEAVILAAAGCALGAVTFAILNGRVQSLPVRGVSWYAVDVEVSWAQVTLLTLLAVAVAGVVAFTSGGPAEAMSTRAALGGSRTHLASLGLLALGCTALLVLFLAAAVLTPAVVFRVLVILLAAVAVGIPLGLPALVQRLARRWVAEPRGARATLAARWLEYSPGSSSRLVAGVGAAVLALCLALPFVSLLSARSPTALDHLRQAGGTTLLVGGLEGRVRPSELSAIGGVDRVVPVVTLHTPGGRSVRAIVASCGELVELSGSPVECPETPAWLATSQSIGRFVGGAAPTVSGSGARVELPRDDVRVTVDIHPLMSGWLLLPPGSAGPTEDRGVREALVYSRHAEDVDQITAAVVGLVPTAEVDAGYLGWANQPQRFATPVRLVTAGLVVGIAIAALAVLVAALSDGRERMRNARVLTVLGAGSRVARQALATAAAAPGLLGVSVAVAVGAGAAMVMSRVDERAAVPASGFVVIWCSAVALLGLTSVVSSLVVTRGSTQAGAARRTE